MYACEWIDKAVISEAKNLLANSRMDIKRIAYELGFPNPSTSGRFFKHHPGKSPLRYRKEFLAGEDR
ncbi:MAG TPA: helix-turn-helix transcriptional regulator [Candidatus Cryptobacteroides intestinipullorum]|nr:helix-turn-helix transcriptional regulator [Candidatus Cryptobacteroides intestinipullorum]